MVVAGGLPCMRLGVAQQGREEAATVATGLWGFAWPGCYETQVNSQHDDFNEGHSQSRPVDSRGWGFSGRILLPTALVSFIAGSLFTAQFIHLREVRADGNRVFELLIYHTVPGKGPALESIFRDAKMLAKYNLNVAGYWVPNEDPAWNNTFI